jgi:lipopolysaccharide export system protein LptA
VRFTIERLRTLVLVVGVLLVIALGVFLGRAKFRYRFNKKDLPHSLGREIQEEANDFKYEHYGKQHLLYRIIASKQAQLKKDGKVLIQLHDVTIELFAEDGSRVDRIQGGEFDYNPNSGIAQAAGPVEITLMKPSVAPAIAAKANSRQALNSKQMPGALASAAQTAASGEIHIKTSGLVFNRESGEASTSQKVEFQLTQGNGSAIGARYDAHAGSLVLDREVELSIQRPADKSPPPAGSPGLQRGAEPMRLFAQHAEFDRDEQACTLKAATARYGNAASSAEIAKVYFRDDGSAVRLDAGGGFSLTTLTGGRLAAPTGTIAFDEHNQPVHGHLQGGVTIDSDNKGRKVHGTAMTMDLAFAGKGVLRSAHLERGVQIASDEESVSAQGTRMHREWSSPVLDIAFRDAAKGRVEPASMHGEGGVVVMASSQRGGAPATPEKLTADDVTGEFGAHGTLKAMTGRGHTNISETTATGVQQSTSGDLLVAHLAQAANASGRSGAQGGLQIESATVDGHVVLVQQPAPKNGVAQASVRATASHAEYGSGGQWLHLTGQPRVTNGGLELTADKLDVSQQSGDAVAQGDVKATWVGDPKQRNGPTATDANFGAQGPTHVVAQEADLQRSSGSAIFKGNSRLWQEGNSIAAPLIVLDRTKQTLAAQTTSAKTPVQVVLVSATASIPGGAAKSKEKGPSVIQVRGGDLKYSGAERKAVMRAGAVGKVVASTADAKTTSNEVELTLLPAGNHAGKNGAAGQVERMTSKGNVEISSGGRSGVGEQLVYTNDTGDYVLTGKAGAPPTLTDPSRGTVTGQALIFNSRDDSVRVEGEGQRTTTATRAPK